MSGQEIARSLQEINSKLDRLLHLERWALIMEGNLAADLSAVREAVAANGVVIDSAVTLINGIAARIQAVIDAGGTPADFQAIADELVAKDAELAAAVAANTPASPAPPTT